MTGFLHGLEDRSAAEDLDGAFQLDVADAVGQSGVDHARIVVQLREKRLLFLHGDLDRDVRLEADAVDGRMRRVK